MPTFEDPTADAAEAQQALRGLAHATRSIDDPTQIYAVLGSLSAAAASFEQSLHQLAQFHDRAQATGHGDAARAAAHTGLVGAAPCRRDPPAGCSDHRSRARDRGVHRLRSARLPGPTRPAAVRSSRGLSL